MMIQLVLLGLAAAADWDRAKAFQFLEQRQTEWANWKPAQREGGMACMSCHTGVPYLLAHKAAGTLKPPRLVAQGFDEGAEAVLQVWTLSRTRTKSTAPVMPAEKAALDRLWKLQIRDGENKGSWSWVLAGLEPWDSPTANYFGAALAQQALSAYSNIPADRFASLRGYLSKHGSSQPLHNRLAWVAFGNWSGQERQKILDQLWQIQEPDGGFATQSMGPWMERESAPPDAGSNAYATAWAAYAAREAGVPCGDPNLRRALLWLERKQDGTIGAWKSVSMNKTHAPTSITAGFMTDAATGFATAALVSCSAR